MDQVGCESALRSNTNVKYCYYCYRYYYYTILSKSSTRVTDSTVRFHFQSKACRTADFRDAWERKGRLNTPWVGQGKAPLPIKTDKENRDPVLLLQGAIWMGHWNL